MNQPIHLRSTPETAGSVERLRYETYYHPEIIEHLSKWIKPVNYLEIGVRKGNVYHRVKNNCTNCYLVDIKF